MASQLSDGDLRKKLKELGEDVGPITPTTRYLFEKRLNTLQEKKKKRIQKPVNTSRTLSTFSSDDSEVDSVDNVPASKIQRKKQNSLRMPYPSVHLNRLNLSQLGSETSLNSDSEIFKKPSIASPRGLGVRERKLPESSTSNVNKVYENYPKSKLRKSLLKEEHSTNTTFEVETSDSDVDSENLITPMRTLRLRPLISNTANHQTDLENLFDHRIIRSSTPNDYENDNESRKNSAFIGRKNTPRIMFKSDFRSVIGKAKEPKHDICGANGYMADDTVLNGEFQNEKVEGKTTNYSHCVSWMLVFATAAFFVMIGMMYVKEVQKVSQITVKNNFVSPVCKDGNKLNCFDERYLKSVLLMTSKLHNVLSAVAGEYECQTRQGTRNMTVGDAKSALKVNDLGKEISEKFDEIFYYSILLIMKNPKWGIRLYFEEYFLNFPSDKSQDVSALEATIAAKSLWCRVQQSLHWTITQLFIVCLVLGIVCLIYYARKFWKKRKELQEKQLYEMVEKIIEILQDHDEACKLNPSLMPYKAVVHVRDMLIPPKEKQEKKWLWDKAVAFIEENESRIRMEKQHIAGEDFKIWRWLPNSAAEIEGGRQGKVWQGQAFTGKGKSSLPFTPTPCLKIRNMFDPEVEYGDDWQVCIQDAILEKCEGNCGIVHIAVDTTSNEGCVYLKCNSGEAAGKAFNALHGWWFDGKLVTVKYLRLERYLERFPAARDSVECLKPSNNKRLSLSAPFYSSALERS